MKHALTGLLLLLLATAVSAVEPSERLTDATLEARARMISSRLRCLVCQNEAIDESSADLARDIRALVRRQLTQGDSDAATFEAVVSRYGEFVLLHPPVRRETWLLWYGPVAMLLTGIGAVMMWLRVLRGRMRETGPLTETEQLRLIDLTKEDAY